jgi:hypothetical protein
MVTYLAANGRCPEGKLLIDLHDRTGELAPRQ